MHCPTITELPPPPEGKTGWPWTEDTPQMSENLSDGCEWARVSIVTPSFNQGDFIEETIRSVLLQGYPDFEYIIIDGGSTDGTLEIIRKYERWITSWVSESDNGQTHAINKGFKKSSGMIVAWLNSDDVYAKGAVFNVVECFSKNPDIALCYGNCIVFDDEIGETVSVIRPGEFVLSEMLGGDYIAQPAAFFKKGVIENIGYLDENFHYAMDYDLLLKIGQKYEAKSLTKILAKFRLHGSSKSVSQEANFLPEEFFIIDNLLNNYSSTSNLGPQNIIGAEDQEKDAKYSIISKYEPIYSDEKLYSNTVVDQSCIVSAYAHMIRNVIRYSNIQMIKESKDVVNTFSSDSLVDFHVLKSEPFFYYMCEQVNLDLTKTIMSESEYYAVKQDICQAYHIFNQRYQIIQYNDEGNSPDPQWILDQLILLLHLILSNTNKSLSKSYFFKLIKDNPQSLVQKRMLVFALQCFLPNKIICKYQDIRSRLRMSQEPNI